MSIAVPFSQGSQGYPGYLFLTKSILFCCVSYVFLWFLISSIASELSVFVFLQMASMDTLDHSSYLLIHSKERQHPLGPQLLLPLFRKLDALVQSQRMYPQQHLALPQEQRYMHQPSVEMHMPILQQGYGTV
jgi:hypothetical protein